MILINDLNYEVELLAYTKGPISSIATFRLKYPRIVHAELMTHRVFSRNASSSRAVPSVTVQSEVKNDPAIPRKFQENKSGMQGGQELDFGHWKREWIKASEEVTQIANRFAGCHKQIVNRITEPFSFINVIVTSTEWDNFFNLRCTDLADPTFEEVALMIREVLQKSTAVEREWHIPYFNPDINIEKNLIVSTTKAAKISYNKDRMECSMEEYEKRHNQLLSDFHLSPFEHCAKPFNEWEVRVTQAIKDGGISYKMPWTDATFCRNFKGFKSYRFLLENKMM